MEKRIGDKIEKKMSEVWFSIRKVSKGEPLEEETSQLTQEQIRGIVAEVVKEETGKIGEQLNQQVTELTKSFASSFSKSKGGGEGGQRLPKEDSTPRPQLNDDEEDFEEEIHEASQELKHWITKEKIEAEKDMLKKLGLKIKRKLRV